MEELQNAISNWQPAWVYIQAWCLRYLCQVYATVRYVLLFVFTSCILWICLYDDSEQESDGEVGYESKDDDAEGS